jgi:voltage-gated potassium channel
MNERGSPLYQLTLLGLSVYVLAALVAGTFFVKDPEIRRALQYVDLSVCMIFFFDFWYNLYKAESRLGYLKWGWIDLISSIPLVDPLRWGRLARVIRILRFLRAIRSVRILYESIVRNKIESLTLLVFLFVFFSYTLSACVVLEFERPYDSPISTAEAALWWAFLNVLNAKISISVAESAEAIMAAVYLNKVGLVVFAYFNALLIAWLVEKRGQKRQAHSAGEEIDV